MRNIGTEEKYQITNSMPQNPSWDAKFPHLVKIFLAFCGKRSCITMRFVLSWARSIQLTLISYFLKISFFPSMSRLSKLSVTLRSRHQNSVCPFPLSHTCHEPQNKSTRCPNVSVVRMSCSSVRMFPFWNWRAEFHDLGYGIWVDVSTSEVGLISVQFLFVHCD
jgi:hypothetical protein